MANLMPRIPLPQDILGMPLLQLQAYCAVYELPTANMKIGDMRDNLMRVRLIYQGNPEMLTDSDRRTLFDAWGIEGDWATAPSDNIAVTLVGYAMAMARRYNAIGYCRDALTVTANNPRTVFTGTGKCDISVAVEAAEGAGLPLTGTAECDITVTVDSSV